MQGGRQAPAMQRNEQVAIGRTEIRFCVSEAFAAVLYRVGATPGPLVLSRGPPSASCFAKRMKDIRDAA